MMVKPNPEHGQPGREKCMRDFLDIALSLQALFTIGAVPNHCFDNAWRLYSSCPERFAEGKFIEGWIVADLGDEVVVNEHGWCELPDGKMVDPSILLLVDPSSPVFYFPGVERDWQEMQVLLNQKTETIFPHVRFDGAHGEDGLKHPAYRAAYEGARHKAFSLAEAANPPKPMTFLAAQDGIDSHEAIEVHIIIHPPNSSDRGDQ